MDIVRKLEIFGDSILKGVQLNKDATGYQVNDHIGADLIGKKYSIEIINKSRIGCTITKGFDIMKKNMDKGMSCDIVVMDFGGNDCDFNWKKIAENPDAEHSPNTPINIFIATYHDIIKTLKRKGIVPILTTLPPIDPQRFFDWFCKDLNKANVMRWLGDINTIYRYQENYSRSAEEIARKESVPLVDLRGAFLKRRRIEQYLCKDGIHPNTEGQKIIGGCFMEFADSWLF